MNSAVENNTIEFFLLYIFFWIDGSKKSLLHYTKDSSDSDIPERKQTLIRLKGVF
jgi:hypothetical protein